MVEQARDTLHRCEHLIELNRQFHEQVNAMGGSIRLSRIVDDLFITPAAIVTQTAASLGVSYPTARSDLRKLEEAGILRRIQQSSQISYVCSAILQITYAD